MNITEKGVQEKIRLMRSEEIKAKVDAGLASWWPREIQQAYEYGRAFDQMLSAIFPTLSR
jgi:hypothetical protein